MKTIEYTHEGFNPPKEAWGEGPWTGEPDKVQWVDEATGLPCLAVRNHMGAWCGYVGVSHDHPAYGKEYDDVPVGAHGGLTFADKCQPHEPGDEDSAVCHVVETGEDDDVWWLGFDCNHGGDHAPGMAATSRLLDKKIAARSPPDFAQSMIDKYGFDPMWVHTEYDHEKALSVPGMFVDTYKTLGYVKSEVRHLAEQLAAMREDK